jgi:hypothetical protein
MTRLVFRCGLLLISVSWFAFTPTAQGVTPAPDGGYPGSNTAEGTGALKNLTTGVDNTAIGFEALFNNTTGSTNTASGLWALTKNTYGHENTATGAFALEYNTTGYSNTATGEAALAFNVTGFENTAMGLSALVFNTGGNNNTATGFVSLGRNTTGASNTATGSHALENNSTGSYNTATGFNALFSNTTGYNNTADGIFSLYYNTGVDNTAIGRSALVSNTTGTDNTAGGFGALSGNTIGSFNIALGVFAGSNLTTGNNNIDIGANVPGVAGEANTIRIGKSGTQKKTFVAGIRGVTVAGGVGVIVGSNGQLGTVVSSARFKEAIKPMDKASEAILGLKPVTFRYKQELDPDTIPQFGLIAEQVEKVNPDLVVRDEDGKVNTVRYEAVNAMLLNEFLKEHWRVEEQQATISRLQSKVASQEVTAAQQEKQIETLTAVVQKVSERVELSKATRQMIANEQ